MNVSILVPLAEANDSVREAHWGWLKRRWQGTLPASWRICEGRAPAAPWIKAHAVQAASEAALPGVWIILDADVLLDPDVLVEAALLVAAEARWVHPHSTIRRLTQTATSQLTAQPPARPLDLPIGLERSPYPSGAGGGCVALTSASYRQVGGFDPRFEGWGREDVSFGRALTCLTGPPVELGARLHHLWHPPQPERAASPVSQALAKRYVRALDDPASMRALIEEVHR